MTVNASRDDGLVDSVGSSDGCRVKLLLGGRLCETLLVV